MQRYKLMMPFLTGFLFISVGMAYAESPTIQKSPLIDIYKYLHQTPELSQQEKETSAFIASNLKTLGYEVTENFGGYALVGVLKNGEGSTVMLRTDMDALPVKEETGLPYASTKKVINPKGQETYVMHACGHDVHMSVFLATAKHMIENKKDWKGTLILVAEPEEEEGTGSNKIIKQGLFDKFPVPDYAIATHVSASLPVGTVATQASYFTANIDSMDIRVRGIGGHGAFPHLTKDPVVLASRIVMALQTIISREIPPEEPALITVGKIAGGEKNNVIPDYVDLSLSVRSYSEKVQKQLREAIERTVAGEAKSYGIADDNLPVIKYLAEPVHSVNNNQELVALFTEKAKQIVGEDAVKTMRFGMAGEDFAHYGYNSPKTKSLMFLLGVVKQDTYDDAIKNNKPLPTLHSAKFAPDADKAIETGGKLMTTMVTSLFQK